MKNDNIEYSHKYWHNDTLKIVEVFRYSGKNTLQVHREVLALNERRV